MKTYRYRMTIFIIILASVLAVVIQGRQKVRYHEDEVMTFALSNSQAMGLLGSPFNEKLDANEEFMEAMTVHKGNQFDYRQVWVNQTADVHPPLYYCLIHTISSLMPDTFNMWMGISVNIIFMILCIILVEQCARLITNNERYALLIAAFFAVCPAVLEMDTFIRMYIMAMFFCLLMLKWMLTHLNDENLTLVDGIKLTIPVVLGVLTHYYCIVFAVLFSVAFGIVQLRKKRTKKLLAFSIAMVSSAIFSILIFPPMIYHIFGGYRGVEAFQNVVSGSDFFYRLYIYLNIIGFDIFAGALIILLIAVIVFSRKKKEKFASVMTDEVKQKWLFVMLPTLVYFIIVTKTSAYIDQRYISLIFPCIIIGIVSYTLLFGETFFGKNPMVISVLILLAVMIGSYVFCDWSYSFKNGKEALDITAEYSNEDCIFICNDDELWQADRNYQELIQYQSVTFAQIKDVPQLADTDVGKEDSFVVFIGLYDKAMLSPETIIKYCGGVNTYEKLYSWKYADVYYFTKK